MERTDKERWMTVGEIAEYLQLSTPIHKYDDVFSLTKNQLKPMIVSNKGGDHAKKKPLCDPIGL